MGKGKLLAVKECVFCGEPVEIRHKARLLRENVFCSHKCEGEYRKMNNPNYIPCEMCGKLTYKKPNEVKNSKTGLLCCSYKCLGELRSFIYEGENNPNYRHKGEHSPLYKTEPRINSHGYRLIHVFEDHPFAIDKHWIREHRYVAEKCLMTEEQSVLIDGKRYLDPKYDVHHIDNNRLNNDPSNLLILTRSEHKKLHWKLKKENENPK